MEDIRSDLHNWLNVELCIRHYLLKERKKDISSDVYYAISRDLLHIEDSIEFIFMLLDKINYYEGKEEEENANKCTNN